MAQLATTFEMSKATIYDWPKQERIDRGEIEGLSTDQAMELAAARRRIRQLETIVPSSSDAPLKDALSPWTRSRFEPASPKQSTKRAHATADGVPYLRYTTVWL